MKILIQQRHVLSFLDCIFAINDIRICCQNQDLQEV